MLTVKTSDLSPAQLQNYLQYAVAKAKLRIILLAIKFMPYNLLSFISQAFVHCGLNSLALKHCTIHCATKNKTI